MDDFTLDDYKNNLVDFFVHEYDNNEIQRNQRRKTLDNKYSNEFLQSVIFGTNCFVKKILELSNNDYKGFIKILLEEEAELIYINLGLIGGWESDTVVKDSDNNLYSMKLLKRIFGPNFMIEPSEFDVIDNLEGDEDFLIFSETYSYYVYIQCKKEIFDSVRQKNFLYDDSIKKLVKK